MGLNVRDRIRYMRLKVDVSRGLEKQLDKFAVKFGIDVSIMRRGLYPFPGPDHINFKKSGLGIMEKDLVPETIHKVFDQCVKMAYEVKTIEDFILHDNLSIKDFQQLNRKARKDKTLFKKLAGHESVITYSKDEFYASKDFGIRFYVNKSLGEDKSLPFMTKLILLEQKVVGMRKYLDENRGDMDLALYAGELMEYAINHEKINILNYRIGSFEKLEQKRFRKYVFKNSNKKKKERLVAERNRLLEIENKGTELDLIYGQMALYSLSENNSIESKNVRKWVDTYLEYETFRTLFSHGMRLENTLEGDSKKFMHLAMEYSTYSRPNCAFLERIYTNKLKVYANLLRNSDSRKVLVEKGEARKNHHSTIIGGKPTELLTFEEFQNNHVQDLKNLGVEIAAKGTGYEVHFPIRLMQLNGSLSCDQNPDITGFKDIPQDDLIVGSKTNTLSLYGSALFNGILGTGLGLLRALPFLPKFVAQWITPSFRSVADESKVVKFNPWKEIKEIYKFNKDIFTEKFYEQDINDIVAERLAHQTIKSKTHFPSYDTLRKESQSYSLDSLIQTNSASDVLKNTLIAGLLVTLGDYIIDPKDTFRFIDYVHWAPEIFGLTWMTFSGVFDKPYYALTRGAKYLYDRKHMVGEALQKYQSSPFE